MTAMVPPLRVRRKSPGWADMTITVDLFERQTALHHQFPYQRVHVRVEGDGGSHHSIMKGDLDHLTRLAAPA
jgi:hypothetical protein